MADEETADLSVVSYIILGLLSYRELSGYDVKQLINKSIAHFYASPAKSQIYTELRRLEVEGLAISYDVPQQMRPDKRMYSITQQGRDVMQRWLESKNVEPDLYRSPFLLRLFLGNLLEPEVLMAQIEARQRQIRQDLVQCEEKEDDLKGRRQEPLDDEALLFPLLVLQHSIAQLRGALAWTDDALAQLKQQLTATSRKRG